MHRGPRRTTRAGECHIADNGYKYLDMADIS